LFKMGACMCLTIHQTVASMTKTVSLRWVSRMASTVAWPPKRLPVHSHSFWQRLQISRRQMRSSRRASASTSAVIVVIAMTPTPLQGVGPVAHGGTTVENQKLLVIDSWTKILPLVQVKLPRPQFCM
jgi:hypothetical protein